MCIHLHGASYSWLKEAHICTYAGQGLSSGFTMLFFHKFNTDEFLQSLALKSFFFPIL